MLNIDVKDLTEPMIINFKKLSKYYLKNMTEFSAFKCSYYNEELNKWIIDNATDAEEISD